ncbi:hypothetical protein llap_3092 [Limosa lapponica baueri]|uniref:Uncharacterized protein n=1 Tax=Limosa lapponica baueri TaxID=1758121 RepID=A0A2I0UKM6_LIMLA|nr:hypothetical protein llap_3092 [Limosa lapponica baueri]
MEALPGNNTGRHAKIGCWGAIANGEKGPDSGSSQKSAGPPFGGACFSLLAVEGVYNDDVPNPDVSGKCVNLSGLIQNPTAKSLLCRCSPSLNDWNRLWQVNGMSNEVCPQRVTQNTTQCNGVMKRPDQKLEHNISGDKDNLATGDEDMNMETITIKKETKLKGVDKVKTTI